MIEIDERARRAVESPVALPPEMATLTALASSYRRRRARRRASVLLGAAGVAVVAFVTVNSLSSDTSGLRVTATAPNTVASTTVVGSSDDHDFGLAELSDRLTREGHEVASDGTAPGSPFAPTANLLCVDSIQVRVYQYADLAARLAISAGISPDGSKITLPLEGSTNKVMLVDWIASPHFFAKGRIIVLVLGDDTRVAKALTQILGPTLSPQARDTTRINTSCKSQGH